MDHVYRPSLAFHSLLLSEPGTLSSIIGPIGPNSADGLQQRRPRCTRRLRPSRRTDWVQRGTAAGAPLASDAIRVKGRRHRLPRHEIPASPAMRASAGIRPGAAAPACPRGTSSRLEACQHLHAPLLGTLHLVEAVEVKPRDIVGRVVQIHRQFHQQVVRLVTSFSK